MKELQRKRINIILVTEQGIGTECIKYQFLHHNFCIKFSRESIRKINACITINFLIYRKILGDECLKIVK